MVNSLTLYPDTSIINDASITQLFVAYKFLNYDLGELETPVSLPKLPPYQPIHYNFKKGEMCVFVCLTGWELFSNPSFRR